MTVDKILPDTAQPKLRWTTRWLARSRVCIARQILRLPAQFRPYWIGPFLLDAGKEVIPSSHRAWLRQQEQCFDTLIHDRFPGCSFKTKALYNWTVRPFQDLLNKPAGGSAYQGGPDWPLDAPIPAVHHFRGENQIDDAVFVNHSFQQLKKLAGRYFWCGPVCHHFGHQVADFAGRALLASLDPRPGALLWHWYQGPSQPRHECMQEWQRTMLTYLNPLRKPLVFLDKPVCVEELVLIPQQQRMRAAPTVEHLAALSLCSNQWKSQPIHQLVYVSRRRFAPCSDRSTLRGGYAGEACLEAILQERGAIVIYPETLSLADQLRIYRNATRLLVAEGSSQHGLELMGYQPQTQVMVICRRRQCAGMELPLLARFPGVYFCDAVRAAYAPADGVDWDAVAELDFDRVAEALRACFQISFNEQECRRLYRASDDQLAKLRATTLLRRVES